MYQLKPIRATAFIVPAMAVSMAAYAERVGFDHHAPGTALLGLGWQAGAPERGNAHWVVRQDQSAPSAPNVMQQSGPGGFAWIVRRGTLIENGFVQVKFKAIAGKEQGAGVVWRWKNASKYYVAEASAIENKVSIHYTENGRRHTLQHVDAPVPPRTWHTLRVEFSGRGIVVMLNDKTYIDLDDGHIGGVGRVGMWTQAESGTAFDDFSYDFAVPVRKSLRTLDAQLHLARPCQHGLELLRQILPHP